MLPPAIYNELYCLDSPLSDIVIDYFIEELTKYNIAVVQVINCDVIIYFDFILGDVKGELKIDRMDNFFQIHAQSPEGIYIPACGDWTNISHFLKGLSINIYNNSY